MEINYVDRPGSCRILPVENTTAGQVPHIVVPFLKIIKDFDLVIEIGYYWGGFTLWLHRNKKEGAKVIGYDISDINREVFDPSVDYRIGDCFDQKLIDEIKNLISTSGKSLIFCDGGSKEAEFNLYSNFLKKGDVIMLHDYYDDTKPEPYNSFPESDGWAYSYESQYSNIKKSVEENSLAPFYYEDFRRCIIGSFVKN
jgi:cephalosporin hydroxylase